MEKKFELTDVTIEFEGHTLHRIKAVRDFGDVKKGDLGGWIEDEGYLSQVGRCWIYDDAKVFGDSYVSEHATIRHSAVCDNSIVTGLVLEDCRVTNSVVMGKVRGNAKVKNSFTFEDTEVYGNASVEGSVLKGVAIYDDVIVKNHKILAEEKTVTICGHTMVVNS